MTDSTKQFISIFLMSYLRLVVYVLFFTTSYNVIAFLINNHFGVKLQLPFLKIEIFYILIISTIAYTYGYMSGCKKRKMMHYLSRIMDDPEEMQRLIAGSITGVELAMIMRHKNKEK